MLTSARYQLQRRYRAGFLHLLPYSPQTVVRGTLYGKNYYFNSDSNIELFLDTFYESS